MGELEASDLAGQHARVRRPVSRPKRSASTSVAGSAAQLSLTIRRSARALLAWIASATSSLPTPVSPMMSATASVGATRSTRESVRWIARL